MDKFLKEKDVITEIDKLKAGFAEEIKNLYFQNAREKLFFLGLIAEVAIGKPVLTMEDMLEAVSRATGKVKFEDIQEEVKKELSYITREGR